MKSEKVDRKTSNNSCYVIRTVLTVNVNAHGSTHHLVAIVLLVVGAIDCIPSALPEYVASI